MKTEDDAYQYSHSVASLRQSDRLRRSLSRPRPCPRCAAMAKHQRARPLVPFRDFEQCYVPGTRAPVHRRHLFQGDRFGGDGGAQLRGERGHHLFHYQEQTATAHIVSNLCVDPASGCGRFAGHGILHRRRSHMELHRSLDLGKRCLQTVQVLAGIQFIPEYIRAGANRRGQVLRCTISYERIKYPRQVLEIGRHRVDIVLRARSASDCYISRDARTIYRGIHAVRYPRVLHGAMARTALRIPQPLLHVSSTPNCSNHYLRFHDNYDLSK